jgi:outer membrane protein assembly factor BamB
LKWSYKAEGTLWDGPAVADGTLYFGDLNGNVYALDAATGQSRKWVSKVEGGVKATPLVANGIVYVGTDQHHMYALKQDTGQPAWPGPFNGRDGENMLVTPVLKGDILLALPNLAGSDPIQLYGLDKNNGQMAWRYPAAKP